jgi:hypothetical protein
MRLTIPRLTPAFALALAAASCGFGGQDGNLGAATGNTLTEAQIDAALGPESQPVGNAAENQVNSIDRVGGNSAGQDSSG